MSEEKIRVLIIEDDEEDLFVTKHYLKNIKTCEYIIDWERDFEKAINKVVLQEHDIYLVDYQLGKNNGVELVKQVINSGINMPFIFLTGMDDYFIDKEAMEVGAIDYLVKSKINEDLLERSIRYAIERKKTEKELIEANNTKDKLFSIISHDLRSPIGSLLNAMDVIMDSKDDIDEELQFQLLRELQKTSKYAFELLDNLLTWSRSQIGALRCRPEIIKIRELAENVIKQSRRNAKLKSIEINIDVNENVEAYADSNMINTVLRNLLSNAIKFTPEMGKVEIHSQDKGDMVLIIMKDTGVGMEKALADKIFVSNSFESTKGTNNESGTGIGLKICKEFVTRSKGEIWVESAVGKGTAFYFTLPKKNEE